MIEFTLVQAVLVGLFIAVVGWWVGFDYGYWSGRSDLKSEIDKMIEEDDDENM